MRNLLVIVLIFTALNIKAQTENDSVQLVTTLEELFTVCNSSEAGVGGNSEIIFDRLAPYLLYCCADEARKGKEAFDYNIADDRRQVDMLGAKIKKWLDDYDSYTVKKFMTQTKSNGNKWYALNIVFKKGEAKESKIFAFLKIGDHFLLGDID